MKDSFTKVRSRLRRASHYRLETGFSMLEAVVVVGVLLALAVGGFFAFGPIAENAKIAKVKSAASEVHTGVLVASMDGDSTTTPQKVIDDWNQHVPQIQVALSSFSAGGGESGNGDFCVSATNVASPHITAETGACDPGADGSISDRDGDGIPDSSDPDIDGDGTPNASDTTPNGENVANPGSDGTDGGGGGTTPVGDSGNTAVLTADTWSPRRTFTNYYKDPGLKTGLGGWTTRPDWTPPKEYEWANTSVSYVETGYNGDAGAIKIDATASYQHGRAEAFVPIDADHAKAVSFKVMTPSTDWGNWGTLVAGVYYTDMDGNWISSTGFQGSDVWPADMGANNWYQYDSGLSYPNNKPTVPHKAYLYIAADGVGEGKTISMTVDRIFLGAGNCDSNQGASAHTCEPPTTAVPNYDVNFDGNHVDNSEYTYSWDGVENASTSKAVSTKAIAAPSTTTAGRIVELKGEGYAPNSTVTPVFYTESGNPAWDENAIYAAPTQTDSSGSFATTTVLPDDMMSWNWYVAISEDNSWRAVTRMTLTVPMGSGASGATPPGEWSAVKAGHTGQISTPSVVTMGSTATVMGRGFAPYTLVEIYDNSWYGYVGGYTDSNGYFIAELPILTPEDSGGYNAAGPGLINVDDRAGKLPRTMWELPVTYQ